MKSLTLTEEQVNKIMSYFGDRPYKEVYQLIDMLQIAWSQQNAEQPVEEQREA